MSGSLNGKVALVTGAGRGIGRACALRLALQGAAIAVADIDAGCAESVSREIRKTGRRSIAVEMDVAAVSQIHDRASLVGAAFGGVDILVNNAGVLHNKPFLEITEVEWDRVLNVNLRGTTFVMQAVAELMIARVPESVKEEGKAGRSFGKIVNISSISGRRGRDLQMHYAASKAAIISITQSAALALARYNINVNAVAPSVVMTSMWEQNDREKSRILGISSGQSAREFIERIPLKRAGTEEDIAAAVAFLCSTDSDYITGQTLNVDGGYEMD